MEQFIAVKAVGNCTQDSTLSDSIVHTKKRGYLAVPSYICRLFRVNKYQKSDEDSTQSSSQHLGEEKAVHGNIKGLGHVHGTHEDFRVMPEEVVNGF